MNIHLFPFKRFISRIIWKLKRVNMNTYESFIDSIDSSKHPKVKTIDETIDEIVNNKKSIARYGDGEYFLSFNRSIGFQKKDKVLQRRLIDILKNKNEECIVGIPEFRKGHLTNFWKQFWFENFNNVNSLLDLKTTYYNQSISREINLEQINKLKKAWENRPVVFVTGKGSRFDVNHEIFNNIASSLSVYGLPQNSWEQYTVVYNEVVKACDSLIEPLVIIALGPTATVLAYDLSLKGIQSLDIGHITNVYDRIVYGKDTPEKLAMAK